MFKKNEKNNTIMRNVFIGVIVLIACVVAVSLIKRYKTELKPNEAGNVSEFLTDTIFDDIKIKISKDVFSRDALKEESYNDEVAEYLKKNLVRGDTVVHVSHGIGIQTLLMAKLVEQAGRVYAFNPSEKYVNAVKSSAKENGFENRVLISALGMSDHSFDGLLVHKNNFPVMTGKIEAVDFKIPAGYSAMTIKVSSIDEQLPNLQNINLLRISVKGDCSDIIYGARNLIKKSEKISIICDFDSDNFTDFSAFEALEHEGFNVYVIQPDGSFLKPIKIEELRAIKDSHLLIRKD